MRIVYMGTPDFALKPLEALLKSKHKVVGVVTQPDRIKGRGKKLLPPPVKVLAEENGIMVLQPTVLKDNDEFLNKLKELNPDVNVVAAYGRILPKEVLKAPKFGSINIHGSLLPKYRGAAPIQRAILDGEKETGITIMQMEEGLDTGDMLLKESISIEKMDYPALSERLSQMGGEVLLRALDLLEKGELKAEKQNEELACYSALIKKEDGIIDFSNKTAEEIDRMIRAYEPWPGAYCYLEDDSVLKFKAGESIDNEDYSLFGNIDEIPFGCVIKADNEGIFIKAKDSVFKLTELQIPGKNKMDAGSYLRGHKLEPGTILR